MRSNLVLVVVGIGLLGVIGFVLEQQHERGHRLRIELAASQRIASERAGLETEDQSLRVAVDSGESLTNLRARRSDLQGTRSLVDGLRFEERSLKFVLGISADPVWPAGAQVLPAGEWKFVGKARPADTLQSVLWAARTGNVERLTSLIGFEPKAHGEAKSMFDSLPKSAQTQFGSPEGVIATYIASQMPDDYTAAAFLTSRDVGSDDAFQGLRVQDANGAQCDLWFKLQHNQDGWSLNVPESVVNGYASQLRSSSETK